MLSAQEAEQKRGMNMQGPLNRKKKVIGQADEENMQTHGEALEGGPVGDENKMEERREQMEERREAPRQADMSQRPMSRPKGQIGQMFGNMNTQGPALGGSAQQSRPAASSSQPQANPFAQRPEQAQQSQQARPAQRPEQTQQSQQGKGLFSGSASSGGRGFSPLLIIVVLAVLLLGGGGGLSGLFGGGGGEDAQLPSSNTNTGSGSNGGTGALIESLLGGSQNTQQSSYTLPTAAPTARPTAAPTAVPATAQTGSSALLQQLLGGGWYSQQTGIGTAETATSSAVNTIVDTTVRNGILDTSVASGSRAKYTKLTGGGRDTVTVMIYMCGADLESRSAMGTKDLQEMLNASYGDNVRVIIYTGGSTSWRNNLVSASYNQVWQVKGGRMNCLVENAGTAAMTNPATLSSFIQYCAQNFPATRYGLILWDHGSGSVSGYGYDEKNARSGSMSLAGLNTAFKDGGVKFDFIGFDACLMATVETALMANSYADYLIASEETEPGIGWYYTNWLTMLGKNTSASTLEIGKQICDDFVQQCASQCRGQATTLSVTDLAELANAVPSRLKAFSQSISSLISNQEYKTVSNARNGSREFAASTRIDQVDLTDLCFKLDTQESAALASALRGAVKYNRINNISNAHGLSVYFPYQKVSSVDKAVSTYAAIGMDSSYSQAIRDFASVEASGQAVSGGYGSAMPSLFGGYDDSGYGSSDMIGDLLSAFLGGGFGRIGGLDDSNAGFLSDRSLSDRALTDYLTANYLDAKALAFTKDGTDWVLSLEPAQWALVTGAEQNVFYDNGEGYVDLGLDALFSFDEQGRMVADMDGTWLAINGQPVAYYNEGAAYSETDGWLFTGRVPALVDGDRVNLLIAISAETGDAAITGIRYDYVNGETETVAKSLTVEELFDFMASIGDTRTALPLQFVADLYDYHQQYQASYRFGKETALTQTGMQIGNVKLPDADKMLVTYRFTDIYNQAYWTPVIGK